MNNRTAAMILNENLVVLSCSYPHLRKAYTFVSDSTWLDPEMEVDTPLVAQVRDTKSLSVVYFKKFLEITDLDLDNEDLVYKFVLGEVHPDLLERMASAEDQINNMLKAMQKARVQHLRGAVAACLKGQSNLLERSKS